MKKFSIAALLFATVMASPALAVELTKGVVKKIDEKQMKVTIKHEELKHLEMPPMTMVFAVKDADMMKKLKAGASIQFMAERVNGKLTVTEIK